MKELIGMMRGFEQRMQIESDDAWWRACCIVSMIQNVNCTDGSQCKDPAHFFDVYRPDRSAAGREAKQREDEIIAARRRRADGDKNPDEQ